MNEKVTMVTGAAAGIGLVSAEAFAKAGATVVLVDINEPKEQAGKLVSEGYKAVAYRCDVSDTQAVKEMIDWIVATYGRLDAALNNTGIQTPQRPMAEITDEEFDRTVAVDLKGVWNCMRYEILQMLRQQIQQTAKLYEKKSPGDPIRIASPQDQIHPQYTANAI